MLIVGGIDNAGSPLATAELRLTARDGSVVDATALPGAVARASHTATVLSNGRVLVAGGWSGGAVILNDAIVYDPAANSWSAAGNAMGAARMNHTATSLDDGRVLLCGGQIDFTPTVTASCDLYDPSTNLFTPTGSLQQGRALHTAVLLKNGRVWFAGGWNPGVNPNYLATTERYNPTLGSFNSAAPLAQARAYHTATLGGDGQVLVVGGFNGDNSPVNLNNFGILQTAELYDPVTNGMAPAAPMNIRKHMHAATLDSDGSIVVFGGLGNVTTSYLTAEISGKMLTAVSSVNVTFTPPTDYLTTGTISGGGLHMKLDFLLDTPVTGIIEDGEILLSSPSVTFSGAQILFTPADTFNSAQGLRIPLNGRVVDCRTENGPIVDDCGQIEGDFDFLNLQGRIYTAPIPLAVTGNSPVISAGTLSFNPQPISASAISNVTGGNFTVTMDILVDPAFIGGSIASGTLVLQGASFIKPSSISVALNGGFGTFTSGLIVPDALGTSGVATITVSFTNLGGQVTADETAVGIVSPQDIAGLPVSGLSGVVRFVPTRVDLTGKSFFVDVATVVVRRMSIGSPEFYRSDLNSWSYGPPTGGVVSVGASLSAIGPTATLLPNNDRQYWGGRITSTGGNQIRNGIANDNSSWSTGPNAIRQPRALHTATLLPEGRVLLAGGTNGPNILRSAELFDPATETFAFTPKPMHDVRDQHSATLLPNGRVLIAGGFTTNATSTGSTSSSELYYPDTGVFLRTPPMISSRSNHTAVLLPDGGVLVAGGFGPDDIITPTAEIFYSTAMDWRPAPNMPVARALHTATLLRDGRVMFAGGLNASGVLNSVSAFNTLTGAWSALAPMSRALHSHTASLLTDGRVLVAGGNDGLGEQDVSMIYDPSANAWTDTIVGTNALTMARFGHSATLLPNGNVLMTGGTQRFGNIADVNELFHPNFSLWGDAGRFSANPQRRAYHTMTLAPNGKLYAMGGSDGSIGGTGTLLWGSIETEFLSTIPDLFSKAGTPGFRRSTITATSPTPFLPNTLFTVSGSQFKGGTEASGGGAAAANSSFSYPRLTLQALEGSGGSGTQGNSGFIVDLTTQIYLNAGNLATLNSSVTVQLPAANTGLPFGWYGARISANDIHSPARLVQVGPAKPTSAPTGIASVPQGSSSMSWTWGAVAGADGYNVYQATTGVLISTTAAPAYMQTGLAANTTASILLAAFTLTGDGPLAVGATNFTFASTATNLTIASVTFTNLLLLWNPNSNEPGTIYEVSQSTDDFVNSFSTPVPNILALTDTQTTIGNLQPNTTYYFRVRAYNGAGLAGDFSAVVSTLTRTTLASVNGTPVSSTAIDWAWTDPTGVSTYRVYNATSGALIAVLPGTALGYSDTGLAVNSRRSIQVSAVTAAGEGPLTPSSTHFTLANAPLAGTPHISNISNGSFTVNWSINGNPAYTEYRTVLYQVGVGTSPVADLTQPGPLIATTFNNLLPGTLYLSSVAAVNGDGVDSTWLAGSTYTFAQAPGNLTVLNTTPVSITVSWDRRQNGPDVQFELIYSSDQFVTTVSTPIPFSAAFTGSSTTILGLQTGTTYWLQVRARTPFGAVTAFEPPLPTLSTITFNGGAPQGSLAGTLSALAPSQIFGSLGNGRQIDVRSPSGAFPTDVTMTISSFNVTGTLCPNGVNVALSIVNAPALQPLKPIYLTLSYTSAEIGSIAANRLVLFRYEPVSGTCVPLETSATASSVRAQLNHFSLFQLGQIATASSAETARIFPNPFRTASDGYVTIDNVPPASRVRLFTLRGELVADMLANPSGIATWAATNASGRAVASGLYLVMVEHGSSKKILKLSVIR